MINIQICGSVPRREIPYKALQSYPSRKNWRRIKCFVFVFATSLSPHHLHQISHKSVWDSRLSFQKILKKENETNGTSLSLSFLFLENRNFSFFTCPCGNFFVSKYFQIFTLSKQNILYHYEFMHLRKTLQYYDKANRIKGREFQTGASSQFLMHLARLM